MENISATDESKPNSNQSLIRSCARSLLVLLITGIGFAVPVNNASAQSDGFGLGVIIGEPTGISFKGWVGPANAFDAGIAWAFGKSGRFHLHGDYLWHFKLDMSPGEDFRFYTGIGGRFSAGTGNGIVGARVPLGFLWLPRGIPLDVFVELVPILDIAPATELSGNGGVGVRYFFR